MSEHSERDVNGKEFNGQSLAELRRGMRNTFALIRSIVRRTAGAGGNIEDYVMHLDGRIGALTRISNKILVDPTAGVDLALLVADELLACGAREQDQVECINGPIVRLRSKAAETFGLAIHELATNAVKYGALSSSASGRISVSWQLEVHAGISQLRFLWQESSEGVQSKAMTPRGFGTALIEQTLPYELQAETSLVLTDNGLECRIVVPLSDRVVAFVERNGSDLS